MDFFIIRYLILEKIETKTTVIIRKNKKWKRADPYIGNKNTDPIKQKFLLII